MITLKIECALNQRQFLLFLVIVKLKVWILLGSEVIDIETSKMPDDDRRQKVRLLSSMPRSHITIDDNIEKRAAELAELGFKPFDAPHVACAEKGGADVLLTTDNGLLRKASQNKGVLKVRLENTVRGD